MPATWNGSISRYLHPWWSHSITTQDQKPPRVAHYKTCLFSTSVFLHSIPSFPFPLRLIAETKHRRMCIHNRSGSKKGKKSSEPLITSAFTAENQYWFYPGSNQRLSDHKCCHMAGQLQSSRSVCSLNHWAIHSKWPRLMEVLWEGAVYIERESVVVSKWSNMTINKPPPCSSHLHFSHL